MGFGRPIISVDERIPPVCRLAEEFDVNDGAHFKLALAIDKWFVENRYRLRLNVGGISAALAADAGFSVREYNMIATVAFSAGMIACYGDAVVKPPGSFFPLRCERVDYEGTCSRKWEN